MKISSMTPLALLISSVFLGILGDFSEAQEVSDIDSPRLRNLAAQLEGGNGKVIDEFWKEMEANTTPLIEAIEGETNHVWLTVLWRGDDETENVILVGEVGRGYPLDNPLGQLLDSDV